MQQEVGHGTSSGFGARVMSPDSVICTAEANFSLFSSTSGSAERCSFASDIHDHDSLASEASQKLTGQVCHEASSSGQDLDPKKVISRKEIVKVQNLSGSEAVTEDGILYLDSARSSFSQALKECQERRSRSEALLKKEDKRRPASLDLNNTGTNVASSPRLAAVKKASVVASQSGMFPSPGTPDYRQASVGVPKGWSSERVPLHTNTNRRHMTSALLPYNNGRALPSKWEDAERWILSPIMRDCNQRSTIQQQQQKPKSKSGPLGPPGVAYYSMYSPAMPMFERRNISNAIANSPFSAGVMAADGMSTRHSAQASFGNRFLQPEPFIARSVSLHGYSELISQSSLPGPQDMGKVEETRDAATDICHGASRRDMATQMSPEGSPFSSPERLSSCSANTPSLLRAIELPSTRLSRSEIRDVQVDEGVTVTRWSKKNKGRVSGKGTGNDDDDWRKKATELRSSTWENSEISKSISKSQREEARIIAWENLQKAKAEAAIRKLEMKLEKKRSSSMDKIMNKVRSAQKKAQQMRRSVIANQPHQVSRTSSKALSFRRTPRVGSLSSCFTCPAF